MIDIQLLRDNPELVKTNAARKNVTVDTDAILELDTRIKELKQQTESVAAKKNKMSSVIASASKEEKAALIAEMQTISDSEKSDRAELLEAQEKLRTLMYDIPNMIAEDVPDGADESENIVIKTVGEIPKFDFEPKDHLELGKILNCIDTEKAAEVSGARFTYIKNGAAELQLALMNFVIDTLSSEETLKKIASDAGLKVSSRPFQFVIPPVMIRPDVYRQMGRLTDDVLDERYHLQQDDLYLVGSAEHTLGPMHMNDLIPESELPLRYIGYSSCFRREAGSYGKDTKGIIRLHQFDKLEMETFTKKEDSVEEQKFIVAIQEYLVQQLGLPYQLIMICTGDMGKMDSRQIDINCWIPTQETYRETHTSDLMTDYQARRLNARYKAEDGNHYMHMNDATAFAMSRILVAILENNQLEDGSVTIPEALQPYMRGKSVLSA